MARVEEDSFRKTQLKFFNYDHNGSYEDMMVQILGFLDPNDQVKREHFKMDKLQTFYREGLNMKRIYQ